MTKAYASLMKGCWLGTWVMGIEDQSKIQKRNQQAMY